MMAAEENETSSSLEGTHSLEATDATKDIDKQATAKNFTADNKGNMWDSIKTDETIKEKEEEDLDVPPSLREKLRARKKKE